MRLRPATAKRMANVILELAGGPDGLDTGKLSFVAEQLNGQFAKIAFLDSLDRMGLRQKISLADARTVLDEYFVILPVMET